MRRKLLLTKILLLITFCLAQLFSNESLQIKPFSGGFVYGQSQTLPQNLESDETNFELVKTRIMESAGGNVVDKRIYKSSNGKIVEFWAEICKTSSEANKLLSQMKSEWNKCSNEEDVINPKDKKVGKRIVCEISAKQKKYAIIYSYNDILTMISGTSLEHVKKFETQTCVRSKNISGIPCKY